MNRKCSTFSHDTIHIPNRYNASMKILFTFTTLLISLLSTDCFSQSEEATIFFKDGESIEGYGLVRNNKIKFRVSLEDKGDFWGHEMLDRIEFETFFGTKTYKYIRANDFNPPFLMELVTEGEVTLYRKSSSSWQTNLAINGLPSGYKIEKITNFLIRKEDDFPTCLNCGLFNKWKKRAVDYFINCPGLIEKIKSNEYREIHMQEIVEYYNDFCSEY